MGSKKKSKPKSKSKSQAQTWISRAECGRRLGVSAMQISRYCQRGLPSRPDKKVSWPASRAWREANVVSERSGSYRARQKQRQQQRGPIVDQAASLPIVTPVVPLDGPVNGPVGESIVSAQLRKERALADLRCLEYAQKRGALIPILRANSWFATQIVRCRDSFLLLPSTLRDTLAAECDPIRCGQILDREIRRALDQLKLFGGRYTDALSATDPRSERVQALAREIMAVLDEVK